MMTLYHGSSVSVPEPLTGVGRRELDFGPGLEKGFWWNAPVEVTFRPKAKASFRMNRFKCSIFDENFFPVCQTHEDSKVKRSKGRALTMEMESNHIWIPGKYILLINEELGCSVIHIDFTLDDNLVSRISSGGCAYQLHAGER